MLRLFCKEATCGLHPNHQREHRQGAYLLRDMLLSQRAYLTAMADYTDHGGKSRGSALYTDLTGGVKPFAQLPDTFTFALDETESPLIQEL